jgi:uncharacterized membrane protein YhiD involved in acid resistance
VAAIGIAVGSGLHLEAMGSTVLVLLALVPLGWLERWLHRRRSTRGIRLATAYRPGVVEEMERLFEEAGLDVVLEEVTRDAQEGRVVLAIRATGPAAAFDVARSRLVDSDGLRGFKMVGEQD